MGEALSELPTGAQGTSEARYVSGHIDVALLVPPYKWGRPMFAQEQLAPLGTIAVAFGPDETRSLALLLRLIRAQPWLVPCIMTRRSSIVDALRDQFPQTLLNRFAIGCATGASVDAPVSRIVAAVRGRRGPTATDLTSYVVGRLGRDGIKEPLLEQFESANHGRAALKRSAATYSRVFRTSGPYTARDWRAVAVLTTYLSDPAYGTGYRMRTTIGDGRACSRSTIYRYGRKYLREVPGSSRLLGWEWILERALRCGGYVS
jgi:hypothetical protein